jgi:hypothetical protein
MAEELTCRHGGKGGGCVVGMEWTYHPAASVAILLLDYRPAVTTDLDGPGGDYRQHWE